MPATLRPIGALISYVEDHSEVPVEAGLSVRTALESLGIPPEIVALVVVNGEPQSKDYLLQEGDDVKLLAIIGGG